MLKRFGVIFVIPLLSILALPACAAVIPLANASFESQNAFDQTAGCNPATFCYNYSLVDWDIHGSAGTFDPSQSPALPLALDGSNVAFLLGGYISQDLGSLVAGTPYTVQVSVAGRDNGVNNYRLGASLGSSAAPSFTEYYQTGDATPGGNAYETASLTFVPLQNANYFVYVAFDGGSTSQLFVDAAPSSAVPETGSFLLVGLGLATAGLLRRKS